MVAFRFRNVCIESFALNLPETEVTSAALEDRLAPLYERLKIPFGTLEKLSGIKARRFWSPETLPSEVATVAAEQALAGAGFDRSKIGAVVNCSVTRDYFEPATGCLVHGNLGLPETVMSFDITNACLGFSNGIQLMGSLIENGVIEAAVITSGENISRIIETSINLVLDKEDLTREELLRLLPTFTLGSGATAMVLCHKNIATKTHRVAGGIARSATQFKDLCKGNGDFYIMQQVDLNPIMHTDSPQLMGEAAKLGGRMWKDFEEAIGWQREELDHIFCHQVGKQVNKAFYKEMTLDITKEFNVYSRYGNLVSSALPAAVFTGVTEKPIKEGEKMLMTGFGSGLNSIFLGIEW
jgi:3-oxoacyl-[acyl-carrier-protein] synthase-3